ncbi:MAG: GTPase HflX [Xanthomonadales bacterium]|nr:GTPase HflX [Xanthomonadales bacterium]
MLVHPQFSDLDSHEDAAEFRELARSAGLDCVAEVMAPRSSPEPATLVGRGKVEEVAELAQTLEADAVLFNHPLSPVQERNLEQRIERRVHDRNTLILDIFAQRARSHEGKLQVELAQLRHLSTRLVRGWTHLERQKGGIGLRGPGETQLETDRRLLNDRVKTLRKRLERLSRQRTQSRRARRRGAVPTVSIVGYTNAGKSTLFNALTGGGVYAADQLFATLDPTIRRLVNGHGPESVLADTVGFIRHLPHELVAAFHSTLEETRDADLLLHVVDAADPLRDERIDEVNRVLEEIGAGDVPQMLVYNKIDLSGQPAAVRKSDDYTRVWVSALDGSGLDALADEIDAALTQMSEVHWLELPADAGRVRSRLFELGTVLEEQHRKSGGWRLRCRLSEQQRGLLARDLPELKTELPKS